jgi:hypothetical protein
MNGYYEYVLKGQYIDLIFLSIVLAGRMSGIAFMNPTRCVGLEYERLSAFNPGIQSFYYLCCKEAYTYLVGQLYIMTEKTKRS